MHNRYSWPVKLVCGGVLAAVLSACYLGSWDSKADARAASSAKQRDPLVQAFFQVEVEGRWSGTFNTCSGLGSENESMEMKVGGDKGAEIVRKVPGRLRWHDVTLTRALTSDMKLWAWRQEVVVGKVAGARQKCTITMMSQDGRPVAVWELANAWPLDLKVGTTDDGDRTIEQVTIAHEGVTRKQ